MTIRHAVIRAAGRVALACAAVIALTAAPDLSLAQGKGKGKGKGQKGAAAVTETPAKPPAPPQEVDCAIYE
ncbi:MAG TPA: hypothetical protein VIG06_24635, partial [Kofleriaceae bacterium]